MSLKELKEKRDAIVQEISEADPSADVTELNENLATVDAELDAALAEADEKLAQAEELENQVPELIAASAKLEEEKVELKAAVEAAEKRENILSAVSGEDTPLPLKEKTVSQFRSLVAGERAEARAVVTLPSIVSDVDGAVADELRGVGQTRMLERLNITKAKEDIYTKTSVKFGSVAFAAVNEGANFTESQIGTSNVAINITKSALYTDLSYETLANLPLAEAELNAAIVDAYNVSLQNKVVAALIAATNQVTAAANTTVTIEDLLELVYSADFDDAVLFINHQARGQVVKNQSDAFWIDPASGLSTVDGIPVISAPLEAIDAENVVAAVLNPKAIEVAVSDVRVGKQEIILNDVTRFGAVAYSGVKIHDEDFVASLVLPA